MFKKVFTFCQLMGVKQSFSSRFSTFGSGLLLPVSARAQSGNGLPVVRRGWHWKIFQQRIRESEGVLRFFYSSAWMAGSTRSQNCRNFSKV